MTTKKQMMADIDMNLVIDSKLIANNTVLYLIDGITYIRLHHTDVVTLYPNGNVRLNSGEWRTNTTKNRMNKFQNTILVYQKNYEWYVSSLHGTYMFYDNIMFDTNGNKIDEGATPSLSEQIDQCTEILETVDELPKPSMHDNLFYEGTEVDKAHRDLSLLKEGDIPNNLALNALKFANYQPMAIEVMLNNNNRRGEVITIVRQYLKNKLSTEAVYGEQHDI